ncbi:hypothetical protein A9Q99_10260 [Gammaproteobacteria bacterium 45_16_T64]|nr:hypothetical protein A9Q99_10260 [Gammaproteobacteria bacterium 45_16_T64]
MNASTLTEKQKYWLAHHQAIEKYHGRLKEYAKEHSLRLQDLYSWRSQLRQKGVIEGSSKNTKKDKLAFAKVKPVENRDKASFHFRLGSVSIISDTFPDPTWLAEFVNGIGASQ